jgi:LysM repeat protein
VLSSTTTATAQEDADRSAAPRVLIVDQRSPKSAEVSKWRGRQMHMLMRHFTSNVAHLSDADYTPGALFAFDRVAILGNDASNRLPAALLEDVARAERPVLWVGYGLLQLPIDIDASYGFNPGWWTDQDLPTAVDYLGERYPAYPFDYSQVRVSPSAQVLASYTGSQQAVPYVVHGANLWYVNGLLPFPTAAAGLDVPALILADILHDFFGNPVCACRQALVNLEGIGPASVTAAELRPIVEYLSNRRIPFSMTVAPAQRTVDGTLMPLWQNPGLVQVLRSAQDHGATIVTSSPDVGERAIFSLQDLGLEPRLIEIATDDAVGPVQFGRLLIDQTPGAHTGQLIERSVGAQLERARALHVVRDAWAVTAYNPATMSLNDLDELVTGLRQIGYGFADPRTIPLGVGFEDRPSFWNRMAAWLAIDVKGVPDSLNEALQARVAWWPSVRGLPWSWLLSIGASLIFLIRLRKQWQPVSGAERSQVESARNIRPALRLRPRQMVATTLITCVVLAAWSCTRVQQTQPADPGLEGWSSLAWTTEFDGYGLVRVEDGALNLTPLPAQAPDQSRAALVVAGDPNWTDYEFTVRMATQQQLRQNSPPNPWETGWLFFRYQGAHHTYYLAHKSNGLELGKLLPDDSQVFLVTTPWPANELGRWYDYRVDLHGPAISVYVDGQFQFSYADPDPLLSGRVGLYSEDARVLFHEPAVVSQSADLQLPVQEQPVHVAVVEAPTPIAQAVESASTSTPIVEGAPTPATSALTTGSRSVIDVTSTPAGVVRAEPTPMPTVAPTPEAELVVPTPGTALGRPPSAPGQPRPPASQYQAHTVQRGDMLKQIAARYGVSMASIMAINAIPNPDSLRIGQVLIIPARTP